jgi:hypothetical protein
MKLYKTILLAIILIPILIRVALYPILIETGTGGGQYNPLTDDISAADERNLAHEQTHRDMRPILLLIYPLLWLTYWGFWKQKDWAGRVWLTKILFVGSIEAITYLIGGELIYIIVILYLTAISLGCGWWVFFRAKLSEETKVRDLPMAFLTGFMFGVV